MRMSVPIYPYLSVFIGIPFEDGIGPRAEPESRAQADQRAGASYDEMSIYAFLLSRVNP